MQSMFIVEREKFAMISGRTDISPEVIQTTRKLAL